MNLNRLLITTAVISALAACGGSDSENDTETQLGNRAPQANDVSASYSGNGTQLINVLENDSDPDADELILISVTDAEYGVTSIQDNYVSYTPQANFVGIDIFNYVMSDGEFEAEAEVTVTMSQKVSLVGRIIDSPIANATVVIEVKGERFTVEADADGRYELPIEIGDLDNNEVLRMRARGSDLHGQAFVTLSSRLLTVKQLLDLAGADGELTRGELNQVQVTQLTTARDVLLTKAAGEQEVTSENIQQLDSSVDPELIMEMAAIIKLLVDDENYSLPEGVETVEDFLENATSYNETLARASENGDLERAIEETINDPDVMPQLNKLLGQYVEITDTPYFMTNRSFRNYEFRDDGTMVFGGGTIEALDDPGRFLNRTYTWHQNGNENYFESVTGEANFELATMYTPYNLMDTEQAAAFLAANGEGAREWSYGATRYDFIDSFRVISLTDTDAVVRIRQRSEYPAVPGTDKDGEEYELIPKLNEYFERTIRLANVNDLKLADGRFTDVTSRPIILADFLGFTSLRNMFQLHEDGTVKLVIDDYYYHYGSAFYLASGEWTAYWSLHDDDKRLRITVRDGSGEIVTYQDNFKHRDQGAAMGLLSIYSNEFADIFISLNESGQVPDVELTAEQLITQLDNTNILTSAVNRSLPDWDGYKLKPSEWFGWSLHNDGTGGLLEFLCDGISIRNSEICEGEFTYDDWPLEELAWSVEGQSILIDRKVDYPSSFCDGEYYEAYANGAPCDRRVIMPLRQTETGIVLGIEYNISNSTWDNENGLLSKPMYFVEPRFMVWTVQSLPELHKWDDRLNLNLAPEHSVTPLDAYNRMNKTRDHHNIRH